MFYPNTVFYFNLYIPLPPFLGDKKWGQKLGQTTDYTAEWLCHTYLVATAFAHWAMVSGKRLQSWKGQSDLCFYEDEAIWGSAECSWGLLTLVAFGEKFIRDYTASKHSPSPSIHLGRVSRTGSWMLCVPCASRFRFTILPLEWPHWRHHTAHALSETSGNFSKTFDDWNTATQCLDLFTSIWMSYFESKLLF